MSSLGSDLKSAREAKGISLEEIAAATRINLKYLKALEEDNLDSFSSDFFARSVIRAVAKAIGLDEKDALERYRALDSKAGRKQPAETLPHSPVSKSARSLLMNAAFFVIGVAIIALTLFVFLKQRGEPPLPAGAARQTETRTSLPDQVPVQAPAAAVPAPVPEDIQGLRLDLAFSEET